MSVMMKKILILIFLILFLLIGIGCKSGRKASDLKTIFDQTKIFPVTFFNLLDPYPSIKQGFELISATEFNEALDYSLREETGTITPTLRIIQELFLNQSSELRETMSETSELLRRMRERSNDDYEKIMNYVERIRSEPLRILFMTIPISHSKMNLIYNTRSSVQMTSKVNEISASLYGENIRILVNKIENISYKSLILNTKFRDSLIQFFQGMWNSSFIDDRKIRDRIVKIISNTGEITSSIIGPTKTKSSDIVLKRLILNLREYFTPIGITFLNTSVITTHGVSSYNSINFPSELKFQLAELFTFVKEIINPPLEIVKDSKLSLAEILLNNFALFEFTKNSTEIDESIRNLARVDLKGLDRFYMVGSDSVSSLDTLLFLLGVVDIFGYEWSLTDFSVPKLTGMASATRTNGPMGGRLSLLDAAYSMASKLDTTTLGLIKILSDTNADQLTPATVKTYRDNLPYVINGNTPALSFLEGESKGEVQSATDSIYTKTIPWVLSWISKVSFSGGAPFYNKNRKDASGRFLTPDGKIYKLANGTDLIYKKNWRTSQYRILTRNLTWAGLGGAGVQYQTIPTDGIRLSTPDPDTGNLPWVGKSYLIEEINYNESERSVNSDEEALYRNFQWLIYEKRFVLTIPVRIKLAATSLGGSGIDPNIEDAVFITVIGNGLKGLMNAKPFCGFSSCDRNDNGKWLISSQPIKDYFGVRPGFTTQNPLNNFSSEPADSVMLVEIWGYGITNNTYNFLSDGLFNIIYSSILFSKANQPSQFYGPIPPAISQLFSSVELLGFIKENNDITKLVTPRKVGANWSQRNRLLPFVVSFAKTLFDQTDRATNKNAFEYITKLTEILLRPYLFIGKEPISCSANNSVPEFKLLKIRSANSIGGSPCPPEAGMRNANLDQNDYFPFTTDLPNQNTRTILSLLIEDNKRDNDGFLILLASKNLFSEIFSLLSEIGTTSRDSSKKELILAIKSLIEEIEVSTFTRTINPSLVSTTNPSNLIRFALQTSINELQDDIIKFPNSRSSNLSHSSWSEINDVINFINIFFSPNSEYNCLKNIESFFEIAIRVKPSSDEIRSLILVTSSFFVNKNNEQDYLISRLVTRRLPKILNIASNNSKALVSVFKGMLRDKGFFIYIENKMKITNSIKSLILDFENLLVSKMIKERNSFHESLLIASGTLIKFLADVTESGQFRPDVDPYYDFFDQKNKEDKLSSYYKRLNWIFSKKN